MSTTTAPTALGTIDVSQTPEVPLTRLVGVEFRKALDTRSGRWFAASILLLTLAVLVVYAFAAGDGERDYNDFLGLAGFVLGYFLPILVILLVTSEASQRTGLVTFTLEPRRPRVVVAKLAAALLLAGCVLAVAAVLAVVGTLIGAAAGDSPTWSVDWQVVTNGFLLSNLFGVLIGFAIAMVVMNTPAGIVGYFVYALILPIAVGALTALVSGFGDVIPWFHLGTSQQALLDGDMSPSGKEWAQIATSAVVCLVLPLAIGVRRLLRIEFK